MDNFDGCDSLNFSALGLGAAVNPIGLSEQDVSIPICFDVAAGIWDGAPNNALNQVPQECPPEPRESTSAMVEELVNRRVSAVVEEVKKIVPGLVLRVEEEIAKKLPDVIEGVCSKFVQEFPPQVWVELLKKLVHPSSPSSLSQDAAPSVLRRLHLEFVGTLPDTLVTLNNLKDQGVSLKVELRDTSSGLRVEVGPESSVKIKIVVLDGDFEVDREDWTEEYFRQNFPSPRKDRGPLLKGQFEMLMTKGSAIVSDIAFTDNSSKTTTNGHFRLGAYVVRAPPGVGIKEAVSTRVKVLDRRGQSQLKHKNPSLQDDIWHLRNIRKNGEVWKRLVNAKVSKVKDFLQLYHTNEKKLQEIAGIRGKKWRETMEDAKSCTLTDECYTYYTYPDGTKGVHLVLGCDFQIKSVKFNSQPSQCYEKLDPSHKSVVHELRRIAYENKDKLETFPSIGQIPVMLAESLLPSSTSLMNTSVHCCQDDTTEHNYEPCHEGGLNMMPSLNCWAPASTMAATQLSQPVTEFSLPGQQVMPSYNYSEPVGAILSPPNSSQCSLPAKDMIMMPSYNCSAPGAIPSSSAQPIDDQCLFSPIDLDLDNVFIGDRSCIYDCDQSRRIEDDLSKASTSKRSSARWNSIALMFMVARRFKILIKLKTNPDTRSPKRQRV